MSHTATAAVRVHGSACWGAPHCMQLYESSLRTSPLDGAAVPVCSAELVPLAARV